MAIMKQKPKTEEEAVRGLTRMVGREVARWQRNHTQDRNDLFQEGMIGVLHAYRKFDDSKGSSFSTYAWLWVRHYIRAYAMKSWNTKNNTADLDYSEYKLTHTEDNIDQISTDKFFSKQDKDVQEIYNLRKQGYTFQEISESLGEKNLHVVRNKFMKVIGELNEER